MLVQDILRITVFKLTNNNINFNVNLKSLFSYKKKFTLLVLINFVKNGVFCYLVFQG